MWAGDSAKLKGGGRTKLCICGTGGRGLVFEILVMVTLTMDYDQHLQSEAVLERCARIARTKDHGWLWGLCERTATTHHGWTRYEEFSQVPDVDGITTKVLDDI